MSEVDIVLREIEKRSQWEFLPIIGPEKGHLLEKILDEKKPCRAVDVGAMIGYATILIARRLPPGCHVYGLEISEELATRAEENISRSGLSEQAKIVHGDARLGIDQVAGPIDFVLLDAQKSQYLSYLKKLEPKLSPGAVIVANGTGAYLKESKGYLDHVRNSSSYQSSSHVFGDDAMEVSFFRG